MFKSNKRNQILLTIFITVVLLGAASGQKCADVGEYCQNHWECCSNSCMTYLYKCVRSYNIYPYTFLSYEPPRRTIEEILELNFGVNNYVRPNPVPQPIELYNRFQGANEVVQNNQDLQFVELHNPLNQPITAEESSATLTKATDTPVIETASRLGVANENVPITTAADASRPLTTQSPSTTSSTTTKPATAATSSTITSSITTTAPPAKCSEIGVKCFKNEECCTERCHGFLHQCVT